MNEFIRGLLSRAGAAKSLVGGATFALDPLLQGSRYISDRFGYSAKKDPRVNPKIDPRYTSTGAPIPSMFPGATSSVGGGNAGASTTYATPAAPVLPPPLSTPNTSPGLTTGSRQAVVQSGPVVPGTAAGNVATTQSFALNPQGQFQRYFGSNQMDQYFGGPAGAKAPKDVTAMQDTAMMQRAPEGMGLADYYRSQSATGRANMDEIVRAMGYTGDMEKWARANPMIAQREYAKQFQGGGPATQGPEGAALQADPSLGATGSTVYNFAAEDVTPERIKAFQDLLAKRKV